MAGEKVNPYSAAPSALGYLYQVRYSLLEALSRLRKGREFIVTIETLDDVVFEDEGLPVELLQLKHHINTPANLTDASPDLWSSIRIWCDALTQGSLPPDTIFFLISTAQAPEGCSAYYLRPGEGRNPETAMARLNSTAAASTNRSNTAAYLAYKKLREDQRRSLLDQIHVLDGAPTISDLDPDLKELAYGFAPRKFLDSFLQRLEGWWYRRAIQHLSDGPAKPILSQELEAETASLREQFKAENLPVDDDIMSASVDASGYQNQLFVHQLNLIGISNGRIFNAIRNYFRAFEQRSRWVREDLLLVGELERYEDRLTEEWDIHFQIMADELGDEATEEAKKSSAQTLYKWVETGDHFQIRPGVNEPTISRGTYQLLSDAQRVGWHVDFQERLRQLLEETEASK